MQKLKKEMTSLIKDGGGNECMSMNESGSLMFTDEREDRSKMMNSKTCVFCWVQPAEVVQWTSLY